MVLIIDKMKGQDSIRAPTPPSNADTNLSASFESEKLCLGSSRTLNRDYDLSSKHSSSASHASSTSTELFHSGHLDASPLIT